MRRLHSSVLLFALLVACSAESSHEVLARNEAPLVFGPVAGPAVDGTIPSLGVSGRFVEAPFDQTAASVVHEGVFSNGGDVAAAASVSDLAAPETPWNDAPFAVWRGLPGTRAARIAIIVLTALALATMAITGSWPPWRPDQLLDRAGVGPFTLYDAQPRGLAALDRSPSALWYGAGIVAAFGIAVLCRTAFAALRTLRDVRADDPHLAEELFVELIERTGLTA